MSTTVRLAIASIFVGVLVLGIKTLAWWLTGSVALFADALSFEVRTIQHAPASTA